MKVLSVNFRLITQLLLVALALAHVRAGPINSIGEKTETEAVMRSIESDETLQEPQLQLQLDPAPNVAAAAAAEAALLELDQEIHGETDAAAEGDAEAAAEAVEAVREKRTIRFLNRIYCTFFRSSASCVRPEPAISSSSSDNDDFWLNYLNSNGTEPLTTTTSRPTTLWGRKREFLRSLFPNLFPERRGGSGGGFLSSLLGGGGSGGGGGGLLASLLQMPLRLFRSFSGSTGFGGGGGGYANDSY